MSSTDKKRITVQITINAPIEIVWEKFTNPAHIVKWNFALDEWHSPRAENDLREGGRFNYRMEAKDGSTGFDFSGEFSNIEEHKKIEYRMDDNRMCTITLESNGSETTITEIFEAEGTNPEDMQRQGWQAILNNFKKYVETPTKMQTMHFETLINAPVEKVFRTMLDFDTYKQWTAEFNPTSYFEGSWDKGSKILFIGTDKDGKKGGMVSRIKENIKNEFISIEHLGMLDGDQEITSGPRVESWAGAIESYTFKKEDGKTRLLVDCDTGEEWTTYFNETWPKALDKLKEICEAT